MSKIEIHADDYGVSLHNAKEIMQLIQADCLDSVSILPNMNCFDGAREYWFENIREKHVDISIHLNFVDGYAVSEKKNLSFLVDETGLFTVSWGKLFFYSFHPFLYKQVKEQLKIEIKAQIEKMINEYKLMDTSGGLRIDSHQHTHMIPIVMTAVTEVLAEMDIYVEYIRDSRELLMPYLTVLSKWSSHQWINLCKVFILNICSKMNRKCRESFPQKTMYLCGVFLSGEMDKARLEKLLTAYHKRTEKQNANLEVLFHPGIMLQSEIESCHNNKPTNQFYLSSNRTIERESLYEMKCIWDHFM